MQALSSHNLSISAREHLFLFIPLAHPYFLNADEALS